jgi:hypothetical protein
MLFLFVIYFYMHLSSQSLIGTNCHVYYLKLSIHWNSFISDNNTLLANNIMSLCAFRLS